MNKIKIGLVALLMIIGIGVAVPSFLVANVAAASPAGDAVLGGAKNADVGGGTGVTLEVTFAKITKILLFVIGAISVIMIIIAGIMYTVSAGDPGKAKKAKDTILYSVVGLVVAILAYAIVNFVVSNVITTPAVTPVVNIAP